MMAFRENSLAKGGKVRDIAEPARRDMSRNWSFERPRSVRIRDLSTKVKDWNEDQSMWVMRRSIGHARDSEAE